MRTASLLALVLFAHAPLAASADVPQRLPGLWEVNVAERGAAAARSFHICVGAGDDVFAQVDPAAGACGPASWRQDGAFRRVEERCRGAAGETLRSGVFGGDFQYNYQGELHIRPASGGARAAGRILQVDGRRLAPCKRLKPGEFVIKGEQGVNLNLGQ